VTQLQILASEHVTVFCSRRVIILIGRTVTLSLPHG